VRVRLPVEREIRAGGFGRAVFTDVTGMVQAVPESAVRYDADGAAVMVVGADNRVHRSIIQTGQRGSGLVQLIKGPPAGTRVVQNAAAFLLDGDLIKPSDVSVAAAAPSTPMAAPMAAKVTRR
jgi:HlyD family secretion protein